MNASQAARLEILARSPEGTPRRTPLLFVHGAFTAAWCWDEHYLGYFAAAGYAAHALSLSGHGRSRGREHLDSLSIGDYVDDVVEAMAGLPAPPVLIGHSMGGFVVQKVLERHAVPAAVLACSVPPQGLMAAAFGLMFSRPGLLRDLNRLMAGGHVALDTLREALFAQPVAAVDLERFYRLAQPESHRAIWDMSLFGLPHPSRIAARGDASKLLVLGTELDHLMPSSLVEMTARTYGVEAKIFPGMGHGLMLERDWETPARYILDWLDQRT
jgi:non-heme chloroperoxidase